MNLKPEQKEKPDSKNHARLIVHNVVSESKAEFKKEEPKNGKSHS